MGLKVKFEIFLSETYLGFAQYIFLEKNFENWKFYLYDVNTNSDVILNEGDNLDIIGYEYEYRDITWNEYPIKIIKKATIKNSDCIVLDCMIDTDDPFFNYDQHYIDLLYYFDDDEYRTLRKQQKIYNFACLAHSNFPMSLGNNKVISIDCSKIQTEYYFYTLLAEALIGEKAYMGAGTDSLSFCLETAKSTLEDNNVINLLNYNNDIRIDADAFDILKDFGFTINFI